MSIARNVELPKAGARMPKFAAYIPEALAAAFVLYIAAIYGVCYLAPGYGLFHDDGIYLVTAKSLAEGTGYKIVSLPSAIPQTKYPPVFPVLLAGVWKIFPHFPENTFALKLVPLLSMLGWMWLSYILLRRISGSPTVCRCIILLTAASPTVVYFSVTLLSEMTFGCLLSAALLLLTCLHEEETSRARTVLLASVLTSATILTRMAGLPLVFAGALPLLLRRKTRQAVMYLLTTVAMLLPWLAWARHAHPPPNSLEAYYSGSNYESWNLFANFTWRQRMTVVLHNLILMLGSPGFLMAGMHPLGWGAVLWLLLVLSLAFFTVYGLFLCLSKGITPLNLFVLFYAALILLWVFPPVRFMIPLLPLLLYFCYLAIRHFFGTVIGSPSGAKVAGQCCVIVLALFLVRGLSSQARKTMQVRAVAFPNEENDDWNEITSLSRWVTGNTPEDAILAGNLDPVWFLSTGRKSVRGFLARPFEVFYSANPRDPLGTYSEFVQILLHERADYLMRTPDGNYGEAKYMNGMIDRLASDYPDAVTLQKQGQDNTYRIYRIDRVKLASDFKNGSKPKSTPPAVE